MSPLLFSSRLVLAAVFAAAGASKAVKLASSRKAVADFGLPPWLAGPAGTLLPFLEIAIAAALVPASTAWSAAVAALALLLTFVVAISSNLMLGRKPDCNCFGHLTPAPIGWNTVARNLALAGGAALIVAAGPARSAVNLVAVAGDALSVRPALFLAVATVMAALAAETFVLWQLFRQNGRLALRMDELERRMSGAPPRQFPQGLAVGDAAPAFDLPTVDGGRLGLSRLRQRGAAIVLLFSDPHCQPCAALLPRVAEWQRQYGERIAVAVISRGDAGTNRGLAARHGVADVLIQRDNEVADAYRIAGTPAGVVVRSDGSIGSAPAMGDVAIVSLLEALNNDRMNAAVSEPRTSESEPSVGLTYGTVLR